MKKLLYILTLGLFTAACGNESTSDSTKSDSVNAAPVNDAISNPNATPGSTTPGEAMGNGDTSSYEGMSNKISDSTHK